MIRAVLLSCCITGICVVVAINAPSMTMEVGALLALIPIRIWELRRWRKQISCATARAILRDAQSRKS